MEKDIEIGLRDIARSYFSLCQNICMEIIRHGNRPTYDPSIGSLKGNPQWQDVVVIVPMLFNFYHGVELFLKLLTEGNKNTHDLSKLFENSKELRVLDLPTSQILSKYIEHPPKIIADWMLKNQLSDTDELYNFLRYPTDGKFRKIIKYSNLYSNRKAGINFLEELKADLGFLIDTINRSRQQVQEPVPDVKNTH